MSYIDLNNGQIAFLIIVPVVVIIGLFFVIYFPIKRAKIKKDYKAFYYKRIYKLAMDKDYYLINNFLFKIDDAHVARIDHILFADKYIYIVSDSYFEGDIKGQENDSSIVLIRKNGKKNYEDNPLLINQKLVNKLCLITGISPSMMIGVCLVNDNCRIAVETKSKSFYIVQSNRFKALVKAIESRDIGNINSEQLASAVKAIDKLNRRRRTASAK